MTMPDRKIPFSYTEGPTSNAAWSRVTIATKAVRPWIPNIPFICMTPQSFAWHCSCPVPIRYSHATVNVPQQIFEYRNVPAMPRKEKIFLVNDIKKLEMKSGNNIVGPLIRVLHWHYFEGPYKTTSLFKRHFYEVLSYSVAIGGVSIFTVAKAVAFIVYYSRTWTAVIKSWKGK